MRTRGGREQVHDWLRLQYGLNWASDTHEAEDAGDLDNVMERGAVAAGSIACFASDAYNGSAAVGGDAEVCGGSSDWLERVVTVHQAGTNVTHG